MINEEFDKLFRSWVKGTCLDWDINEPSEDYYSTVYNRLGEEILAKIVLGIKDGNIIPSGGAKFKVYGQLPDLGAYQWFSRNRNPQPCPNWEYFIQLVEFSRLVQLLKDRNEYKVLFAKGVTIDIGVYRKGKLFVLVETKESEAQIPELLKEIRRYEDGIDYTISDRHNDALRKAKYIMAERPKYFALVANRGATHEYKVEYSCIHTPAEGKEFKLEESPIDWS